MASKKEAPEWDLGDKLRLGSRTRAHGWALPSSPLSPLFFHLLPAPCNIPHLSPLSPAHFLHVASSRKVSLTCREIWDVPLLQLKITKAKLY